MKKHQKIKKATLAANKIGLLFQITLMLPTCSWEFFIFWVISKSSLIDQFTWVVDPSHPKIDKYNAA